MVPNHVRYQTALHLEILFTILYYSKTQLFSSPFYLAGVEGLEPRRTVLETDALPTELHPYEE